MTERQITWDPAKDRVNRRKHRVAFEDAALVFFDPLRVTRQDRVEGGELRWQTTGVVRGVTILLVAHTLGEDDEGAERVRIISARKATPRERRRHEQERE
jgi:uncharacterized DUF497 family protein